MKINGNYKDNSPNVSKEQSAEIVGKKAVAALEDVKVTNFDPAKTWLKISKRLSQADKRLLTWGLTLAASVSLLMAAHMNIFIWNMPDDEKIFRSETEEAPLFLHETETAFLANHHTNTLPDFDVKHIALHKKNTQIQKQQIPLRPVANTSTKDCTYTSDAKSTTALKIPPLANPFVSGYAKVTLQETGILIPEIGIDFKLAENYTAKRREIYRLGLSSQFNVTTNESGDKNVLPYAFLNFEYTSLNKHTNKGWTSKAGYLLNPDGLLYRDTTIKWSLFRNLGKHFKIGPEVIFSDGMQKIYPGISLILG